MKKTLRVISLLVAALLAMTAFAACADSTTEQTTDGSVQTTEDASLASSTEATAQAGEHVTLTVLIYVGTELADELKNAFAPFEEANNCTMDIIISPLDQYDQKMSTMIAGNTAPDIFWSPEYSTPQYYYDGFAADLSGLMDDSEFDWADFAKGQQDHYMYDGKLIGVPFSGQPLVLFYNKTLFENAGLKTPTELYNAGEWTVDAMLDAAEKLADPANDVFGIDLTTGDWANWDVAMDTVLRWYGGEPWSSDFSTANINSDAALKGTQAYYDLIFEDKAHPMPGTILDFAAGKLGMVTTWFSRNAKWAEVDFDWDVVPMPLNENGESTGYGGSAGYMVYSEGPNVDLAIEAIKFITSKEVMPTLIYVPTRISGINSDTYRQKSIDLVSDESYNSCLNEDVLSVVPVKYPHPQYAQCTQVIQQYLESMYAQSMTPEEALDAMAAELQPLMLQ